MLNKDVTNAEDECVIPFGLKLDTFEFLKLPIGKAFKIQNPKSKIQNGMSPAIAKNQGKLSTALSLTLGLSKLRCFFSAYLLFNTANRSIESS